MFYSGNSRTSVSRKIKLGCGLFLLFLGTVLAQSANSQTIVNVSTSVGDFSIELFDSAAPATVANFLSYVTSGRYDGTFIHRTEPGFVVQGGFYGFDEPNNFLTTIELDPPVINEFNQSNTRGTLAMAKLANDPNSATSQWFVNLADNGSNLDNQNGGFTVFGRVIEPGMTVVDGIAALPRFALGVGSTPLVNYIGGNVTSSNFVTIEMSVATEPEPEPVIPNLFNETTGLLELSITLDNEQFIGLSFTIESTAPQVVIRALPDSLVAQSTGEAGFSSFSTDSGALVIPELYVNGNVAYRNLRLTLSDAEQLLFTLESLE